MSREEDLAALAAEPFDVVVVGGGITGAGVLRLAGRHGLRAALLERRDFAWGTSSRSGKLVHGGLRYIAQGQIRNSFHSVRERERLLRRYPGLVRPLEFCVVPPGESRVTKWGLGALLALYEGMAGIHTRRWHAGEDFAALLPGFRQVAGGYSFQDGTTDDARLVLRVLAEGQRRGGLAVNYAAVRQVLRRATGAVSGVVAEDTETGRTFEIATGAVINATGAWAEALGPAARRRHRPLRPLRGSHLLLPRERLPIDRAVALPSPRDGRSLYALPWLGRTLLGTTDLDHDQPLDEEPHATPEEGAYLLEAANHWFPGAALHTGEAISTLAGVRAVEDTGKANPSRESREEILWSDGGLITISGGKLTTFSRMAREALEAATAHLGIRLGPESPDPPPTPTGPVDALTARYGVDAPQVRALAAEPGHLEVLPGTPYHPCELRWAARRESVRHLDDLLLRRLRLGLLLPQGGRALLGEIRALVQADLGWEDERWQQEQARYLALWQRAYSPALAGGPAEEIHAG